MFWTTNAQAPAAHDDYWYTDHPIITPNGTYTTLNSAARYPAVYSCVRVISEALMSLPLILYRRLENGGKERATEHPLYYLVHDRPTDKMTSAEWVDVMGWHLGFRGNFYAYKGPGAISGGKVVYEELPVLHPDKMNVRRTEGSNNLVYEYTDEDGSRHKYPESHILHIRGPSYDGVMGLNPIELHYSTSQAALTQVNFMRRFYENDAQPGGWIEHQGKFTSERDREEFRKSWQRAQTGKNQHKTAVLEHGMKYHTLDMKMSDAQFIESRKYTNHDIARIFRVPPHKIGELDRSTHSNIEQQAIEFKQDTVLPWATRIERRLSMELLSTDEQKEYFFEFVMEGLERGDSQARSLFYHHAVTDGWMTRNEARTRENLNVLEGLDEPLTPMNMDRTGGADNAQAALDHTIKGNMRFAGQRLRALHRKHEGDELAEALIEFRTAFIQRLSDSLALTSEQATRYVDGCRMDNLEHWETDNMPDLIRLVEESE